MLSKVTMKKEPKQIPAGRILQDGAGIAVNRIVSISAGMSTASSKAGAVASASAVAVAATKAGATASAATAKSKSGAVVRPSRNNQSTWTGSKTVKSDSDKMKKEIDQQSEVITSQGYVSNPVKVLAEALEESSRRSMIKEELASRRMYNSLRAKQEALPSHNKPVAKHEDSEQPMSSRTLQMKQEALPVSSKHVCLKARQAMPVSESILGQSYLPLKMCVPDPRLMENIVRWVCPEDEEDQFKDEEEEILFMKHMTRHLGREDLTKVISKVVWMVDVMAGRIQALTDTSVCLKPNPACDDTDKRSDTHGGDRDGRKGRSYIRRQRKESGKDMEKWRDMPHPQFDMTRAVFMDQEEQNGWGIKPQSEVIFPELPKHVRKQDLVREEGKLVVCKFWPMGNCVNDTCRFAHYPLKRNRPERFYVRGTEYKNDSWDGIGDNKYKGQHPGRAFEIWVNSRCVSLDPHVKEIRRQAPDERLSPDMFTTDKWCKSREEPEEEGQQSGMEDNDSSDETPSSKRPKVVLLEAHEVEQGDEKTTLQWAAHSSADVDMSLEQCISREAKCRGRRNHAALSSSDTMVVLKGRREGEDTQCASVVDTKSRETERDTTITREILEKDEALTKRHNDRMGDSDQDF